MKPILILIMVLSAVLQCNAVHAEPIPDARVIMERNYYASKLLKIQQTVKMRLINSRKETRERELNVKSALQENGVDSNMLVRFVEPADVRGTAFLQLEHGNAEDDLWIYLPALFKSRRLVSSNKKDSFIGSDFAYGDMLPPKVELYEYEAAGEEAFNGFDCYVVEAVPANDKVLEDYGYSRKKMWIHKNSFHEVKVEYYDDRGELLKIQNVSELKHVDTKNNRWLATVRRMENVQTEHATLIEVVDFSTDVAYSRRTFSKRNLERF